MGERGAGPAPADSLGRRFLLGGLYVGIGSWGTTLLRFAANIALARMLGPELLGFYAFVFSVNEFLNVVGAFSPGHALMQAPETSREYEDSAFAIAFWLGVLGLAAALVVAPFLWSGRSGLAAALILMLAIARFVTLLGSVPFAKLERELRYRPVAIVNVVAGVVPSLAAVGLAWLGGGVWALLVQDMLIALALFALPMLYTGYRFEGRTDAGARGQILAFGRNIFASRTLEIAMQRVDRLVVVGAMGDVRLGLYHQARILSETGLAVGRPVSRMAFNLYSRVQQDHAKLTRAFALTDFFIVRIMFAGAAALAVFPEETVRLLLGEAWIEAAPVLRLLSVHAALLPVLENSKWLLYGRGHVRAAVVLRATQLVVLAVGLAAAAWLRDVRVAAASLSATTLVGVALAGWASRDVTRGALRRDFLAPGVCLGAALLLLTEPVRPYLAGIPAPALPFLPPLVFCAGLVLLDRGQLLRNLRTLRETVRA